MVLPAPETTTQSSALELPAPECSAAPGIVVIHAQGKARCRLLRWEGKALELGREELSEDDKHDSSISRRHVRLELSEGRWQVSDFKSRNGTFVNASRVTGSLVVQSGSVVRVGGTLLLLCADILVFRRYGLGVKDDLVAGPALRRTLESIELSQRNAMLPSLLISGETGSGKELAAKVFHEAGAKAGAPFVAVNCATVPKDLAERLFFGSRRGAFSGAIDAPGHVQIADGGTLFLDEVAELPLDVQSKLLRMLEKREVLRLGATHAERVDVRVCAATWRDLRREVALGTFREDLYFRIGQPEVRVPPLRERVEEIPWHIQATLASCGAPRSIEVSATFVEACIARHWPGNVRELRAEVRRAAAAVAGEAGKPLTAEELSAQAGTRIRDESPAHAALPNDEIAAALSAEAGNVAAAARRLGVHRNKVRRWLERNGVDVARFKRA